MAEHGVALLDMELSGVTINTDESLYGDGSFEDPLRVAIPYYYTGSGGYRWVFPVGTVLLAVGHESDFIVNPIGSSVTIAPINEKNRYFIGVLNEYNEWSDDYVGGCIIGSPYHGEWVIRGQQFNMVCEHNNPEYTPLYVSPFRLCTLVQRVG